ncbi:DUF4231 domain-containing protein [Mycoplasmopsis cynos]|uniref:DUF4231 domain-containing protein n=1 Tax=Mycoplasmopsis cynos TaxID=171284 RepID=UPI002AFFE537|nr:DUF4231 domain-containing protein [Mycoplasmopsis cynos]WQQ17141.1 DUF4231 domain-containing protein [Mycoplasmopsis cynos]
MKSKNQSAFYKRFLELQNKTKIKKYIYGILYYFLNTITFISTLYVAIIAVYFLAGNNSNYQNNENPYRLDFWKDSSNYILATTIINSLTSMISSLIAFFAINNKFRFYKEKFNLLKFEHLYYQTRKWIYFDQLDQENDFRLMKRALNILEIDRYKSSSFLYENKMNKEE